MELSVPDGTPIPSVGERTTVESPRTEKEYEVASRSFAYFKTHQTMSDHPTDYVAVTLHLKEIDDE